MELQKFSMVSLNVCQRNLKNMIFTSSRQLVSSILSLNWYSFTRFNCVTRTLRDCTILVFRIAYKSFVVESNWYRIQNVYWKTHLHACYKIRICIYFVDHLAHSHGISWRRWNNVFAQCILCFCLDLQAAYFNFNQDGLYVPVANCDSIRMLLAVPAVIFFRRPRRGI